MSSNVLLISNRYDSAVQCRNQTYCSETLCPQEMKKVAQHARRRAPDVVAIIRHGVERAASVRAGEGLALVVGAVHQKASGTSKISATSEASAASSNGGAISATTGVTQ